jgi:ligand-binding sensor domain-containing protein
MLSTRYIIGFSLFFFLNSFAGLTQKAPINFHHLTVREGLNDGVINGICQDRRGYMWFASLGGLNRYDGTTAQKFTHIPGDTNSIKNAVPYALASGHDDRIWIGYTNGLSEFNTITAHCKPVKELDRHNIYDIRRASNNKLYMVTSRGPVCYDPVKGTTESLYIKGDTATYNLLFKKFSRYLTCKNNQLFFGVANGIVKYDINTKKATFLELLFLQGVADRVVEDREGFFWISQNKNYQLYRVSADGKKYETFEHLLISATDKRLTIPLDMVEDRQGRMWIITGIKGIVEYNSKTKAAFYHRHNDQLRNSLSSDILRTMFLGDDGTVWVTSNEGIDFFHPDKNLFTIIYPFADSRESKYARGITEDHKGNFWFTTNNGISKYDPQTGQYRTWRNEAGKKEVIYFNSVRGIIEDNDHKIWIATGGGVNKLDPASGKMDFLTARDSLPPSFFFSANKTSDGTIWFGTRDYDGFYYYSPLNKKIHSIASHPVLKKYKGMGGRYVFEDSKKRLWLGFNGHGVVMYDPATNKAQHWVNEKIENPTPVIAGNLIVDIKEDKKGIIWISSFGGITGVDKDNGKSYNFNDRNGLKSNIVGPIAVDAHNRLWIGTGAGLAMLDSNRKNFTYFGDESGLNVEEFPEHPGIYAANGDIIFPSVKGYIRFNPLQYKEAVPAINYYVSAFNLFDKEYPLSCDSTGTSIRLKPTENFFSINLVALNYENPSQTWFAYLLEGFDKEWHYTQDPKAVYTNVPGGKYTFRYKATANVNDWNVAEKKISIQVGKVFYKTTWFWTLIGLLVIAFLYWFYRNRIRQEQQVHLLQSKAQALEKEKALVMYESLKQQLNPHFLFNSLTSLGSLINTNPKVAGEFLDSLSKTYRYILKSRDSELVPLVDEIKFAESYVKLQRTRFEKGLEVNINIDEEYNHRKIVPVTLQNMIENAIKHNIIDEETPLVIDIYVEDDCLMVRNNLQKKKFVETSNKQGLVNMQSLYHYLSNRPVEITEHDSFFIIKIPLL